MHHQELIKNLQLLALPKNGYCIFGGACLAVRDIRETDDIDVYVAPDLYEDLKGRGWEEKLEPWPQPYLVTSVNGVIVEVYRAFESEVWQPRFNRYLKEPELIDGYRFMPLGELYKWKMATRRPKDVRDLELIEAFWRKQGAER
jgi:hypothetical protein